MDVRLPDGTIIKNVPDGTSKADLVAKLQANGYDISKLTNAPATQEFVVQTPQGQNVGVDVRFPSEQTSEIPRPRKSSSPLDALTLPFRMGAELATKPRAEQAAFIAPAVEALGAGGGAILGSAGGPLGTVLGSGAGYAGAKELMRQIAGTATPETLPEATARVGKEALIGSIAEAGGRGVIGPVIDKAAKAAGWMWDAARGALVQVRAGKIIREIAGADLDAIKSLSANAPANLTAAQAAAAAQNDVLAALGERAAKRDVTNYFARLGAEQEAGRRNALTAVTPDLAEATAARQQAAEALYGRARAADVMRQQIAQQEQAVGRSMAGATGYTAPAAVSAQLESLRQNPVIAAAAKEAKTLAATQGTPMADPMASLEGLHLMKVAIDNQFKNRTASTALQNYSDAALNNTKNQLLAAIEGTANQPGISPLYGAARQTFAEMSAPINQAQVLQAMGGVLAKPGGGERVTPFLNVLGQGENALLRRANQQPRFGGIEEVLTPQQMQTVSQIAGELTRDRALAEAAKRGRGGLSRILGETEAEALLPPSISFTTRVTNKVLSILEGRVNESTLKALETGMRTGKDLNVLLNTLPGDERVAILNAIRANAKDIGRATAVGANALRGSKEPKNENALSR